ncbi:MAG: hypothetical protein WBA17_04740 [Saprospiraceae bacterium]
MRYRILTSLLFVLAFFFVAPDLSAQFTPSGSRDNDRREERRTSNARSDSGRLLDDLWFGGGAVLAYQGGNFGSLFQIGITPMVGYKFVDFLSVGPRVSYVYNALRQETFNGTNKSNYSTYSAGMFARAKIIPAIFAHIEYSFESQVIGFLNDQPVRSNRGVPYVGAGYQSGGGPGQVGFELSLLFNLNNDDSNFRSPYDFRAGINYNF